MMTKATVVAMPVDAPVVSARYSPALFENMDVPILGWEYLILNLAICLKAPWQKPTTAPTKITINIRIFI